jgi:hypothetical protein
MTIAWTHALAAFGRLIRCRKAATAAEYAVAAALMVTAWGATDPSHLHAGTAGTKAGTCTSEVRRGVSFRWDKDAIEAAPPLCTSRKPAA